MGWQRRAVWALALTVAVGCSSSDPAAGSGGASAVPSAGASGQSSAGASSGGSAGGDNAPSSAGVSPVMSFAGRENAASGGAASGGVAGADAGAGAGASGDADNAGGGPGVAGGADGASGAAGSTNGACSGLFCEDFETGAFDPQRWSVKTSGGQTAVVQKTKVAHGTYAAQFHALPNVLSYDLIITKNAPAGLRGHHFGRAYFYVTPKLPDQHATLLWAGSTGFPTFKRLEVASIHTGFQLTSVNQTGINSGSAALAGTTETYASGGTLPVEQWLCLEWEFNDAPDQARVFVNGKDEFDFTHIVLDGKDTGQVGGFADFGFGVYIWHPATYAFDVFYDDIVLDTKRVGCLP